MTTPRPADRKWSSNLMFLAAAVGRTHVALCVEVAGFAERRFVQFLMGEGAGNAEKGVHRAFRIRCDQHQAVSRLAEFAARVGIGHHASIGQILQEISAGGVVRNLAGIVGAGAEGLHGNQRVCG